MNKGKFCLPKKLVYLLVIVLVSVFALFQINSLKNKTTISNAKADENNCFPYDQVGKYNKTHIPHCGPLQTLDFSNKCYFQKTSWFYSKADKSVILIPKGTEGRYCVLNVQLNKDCTDDFGTGSYCNLAVTNTCKSKFSKISYASCDSGRRNCCVPYDNHIRLSYKAFVSKNKLNGVAWVGFYAQAPAGTEDTNYRQSKNVVAGQDLNFEVQPWGYKGTNTTTVCFLTFKNSHGQVLDTQDGLCSSGTTFTAK